MIPLAGDKRMLGYGIMMPYSNIFCFSTTRHGGNSTGNYSSFNCTPYTGDDKALVRQNQKLLCEAMPESFKELVIPFQTHGTQMEVISQGFILASDKERENSLQGKDALMTKEPGYCICISTADCIPILLYDRKNQAIAAVHAGWRGTANTLLQKTLEQMQLLYGTKGKDIVACIGPGISLASFEIGEEVYEVFRVNGFPMNEISQWNSVTQKHHIDLWKANHLQLLNFGVPHEQIEMSGICTYIHHKDFFSARRLGIKSGRILSGIMLIDQQSF